MKYQIDKDKLDAILLELYNLYTDPPAGMHIMTAHNLRRMTEEMEAECKKQTQAEKKITSLVAAFESLEPTKKEEAQLSLDDAVHDSFSMDASSLNNQGADSQIRFLVEEEGTEKVKEILGLI